MIIGSVVYVMYKFMYDGPLFMKFTWSVM